MILGVGFVLPILSASAVDWPMFRFNPEHTAETPEVVRPPLAPIWTYYTGSSVESSPAVSGGILYVAVGNGKLYAFNATTGTQIWNCTTGDEVHSSPAVSGGIVYIGSYDGNVYAFAPVTLQSIEFDGFTFAVSVVSSSMISDITFNQPMRMISFDATGETGTAGCCKITIPKELLDASPGEWTVLINDIPMAPTIKCNTTHTLIYVPYTHSVKTIKIIGTQAIPEFPSFLILPLFMIATLLAVVIHKRRRTR